MFVPLKLEPETDPEAATDVGVMAPSARVIAGVVVAVETDPDTPFAEVTDTDVTVPVLGPTPAPAVNDAISLAVVL